VKEYPLSDDDIRKILGSNIKIWNYPQLKKMKSIHDMFDNKGRAILLFPNTSPTSGHWCCLINYKNKVEFYDPYGDAPEQQKGGMTPQRLEALDIDHPDLTRLLRTAQKPVYYNTHQFQKSGRNIATCGRWCCCRLLYSSKSLPYFKGVVDKSGMNPDDFVSGLTYDWLKK